MFFQTLQAPWLQVDRLPSVRQRAGASRRWRGRCAGAVPELSEMHGRAICGDRSTVLRDFSSSMRTISHLPAASTPRHAHCDLPIVQVLTFLPLSEGITMTSLSEALFLSSLFAPPLAVLLGVFALFVPTRVNQAAPKLRAA
jgi:hypothetical protein